MSRLGPCTLLLGALALAGCASPPVIANPSPFDEDDPSAQPAVEADPKPEVERPEPVAAVLRPDAPSVIDRESLHRVLAAGPGAYAGLVMIEAIVDGGDLKGWRLTRWEVPWRGLVVGDVIIDVNGVAIVNPDDLMALWGSLWEATEIAIRLRGDEGDEIRRFAVR